MPTTPNTINTLLLPKRVLQKETVGRSEGRVDLLLSNGGIKKMTIKKMTIKKMTINKMAIQDDE